MRMTFTGAEMAAARRALQHELDDPRGYTWYNHVAARAIVHEGFRDRYPSDDRNAVAVSAMRAIQEEKRAGRIRHIGAGKWARATPPENTKESEA